MGRNRGWIINFQADEVGWVTSILFPVYRVGQVQIEHSSKRLKGKIYRESGILDLLWYCVFRASRGFAARPQEDSVLDPLGDHCAPKTLAELSNRDLTQMRIRGQKRLSKYITVQNARIYGCYLHILG